MKICLDASICHNPINMESIQLTRAHTHTPLSLLNKPYITAFLSSWPGLGGDREVGDEEKKEKEEEVVHAGYETGNKGPS